MRVFIAGIAWLALSFAGTVGISVNGAANGSTVEQGLPVILSVTSVNSAPEAAPDSLEAAGPDGARAVLVHRAAASDDSALGTKIHARTVVWTLGPDDTATLPAGRYTADLPNAGQVSFTLAARESGSESIEAREQRLLLLSSYAEIAADHARALELAKQFIADHPAYIEGNIRLSDLLVEQGEFVEALRLLGEAERQIGDGKHRRHPPVLIRSRQTQILDRLLPAEQ